jgi:hypothetical protein
VIAEKHLAALPVCDRFYRRETVSWHELIGETDRMGEQFARLDQRRAPSRGTRAAGLVKRAVRR